LPKAVYVSKFILTFTAVAAASSLAFTARVFPPLQKSARHQKISKNFVPIKAN
jgi:hypothetical protein